MPRKKSRHTSARAAKMRRQAKTTAARRSQQARTDLERMLDAFAVSAATGAALEMVTPDGTRYTATLDNIRQHINAGLAQDGEPPADAAEAAQLLADDILIGALYLRPDGVWESAVDYRIARRETA